VSWHIELLPAAPGELGVAIYYFATSGASYNVKAPSAKKFTFELACDGAVACSITNPTTVAPPGNATPGAPPYGPGFTVPVGEASTAVGTLKDGKGKQLATATWSSSGT
jgi:hypothetical protein